METGACGYGGQDCGGTKGVTIFEKPDEIEDSPKPGPKRDRIRGDEGKHNNNIDDNGNPSDGFNEFPEGIGYRIPSIPMTSFPIDIWFWRWTIKADGNVTYKTPLSPIVISADGFVVGDGKIDPGNSTYWFTSATVGQGYNSANARVGAKFSWDSVSMVSRNSVSYTNGNYSLNARLTQEFEYRPKNAITGGLVGAGILIYLINPPAGDELFRRAAEAY